MKTVEQIQSTPIYRLTLTEVAKLPDEDQRRAYTALLDMARDGDWAMFSVNPPGTTYEVVWDKVAGWKLNPICSCQNERRFVEAYDDYNG